MNLVMRWIAKREIKKQQKQKTIKELKYEISVKDTKIKILEDRIEQLTRQHEDKGE